MLSACTIIASNYLAPARVLADSFRTHHPGSSFTVLVIDDEDRRRIPDEGPVRWMRMSDLDLEGAEIRRLAGIYDVTELATALKPRLLETLIRRDGGPVIYLDPDICIYASLESIGALASAHGIVLTPHTMRPFPRDERQVDQFFILAAGVYNLGFIAVGAGAEAFLDWWWQATRREALVDVARMMFTDQRLVDFVPAFFDHAILKDPGCNVAYWNLHGRSLSGNVERFLVDGCPLRFFHFSGYDVRKPWLLSKYQGERPRVLLSEQPVLAALCDGYATRLHEAGVDQDFTREYGWGRLPSGVRLTTRMRRLYWKAVVDAEKGKGPLPPDPFDRDRPDAFLDWLNSPGDDGPRRISRYLHSIYLDRIDLQVHFPDLDAGGAQPFLEWMWKVGISPEEVPLELLPAASPTEPEAEPAPRPLAPGLNIVGYLRAELGIGEAARLLISAVERAGIPHKTTTYAATLSRQSHAFEDRRGGDGEPDVNVLCINADMTPSFARQAGPAFFDGRHTVGYWFWEIEEFPPEMHAAFDDVDEVWTATEFVASAVRAAGRKPVFTIPLPVPVPRPPGGITRDALGLPPGFLFLLTFDFLSVMERKNPLGLIAAYSRAFQPGHGTVLVIKSMNGDRRLGDLERLRLAAAGRPDIHIVDRYFEPEQKDALVGLCDCYVSLHRSEGLGLTMAEAMAAGKPVVATAYSGNMHFMTPGNSFLVNYSPQRVPTGCPPYPAGATWAEPDLEHAGRLMREIFEQPSAAAVRARRGQQEVLQRHGVDASAAAVAKRMDEIRKARAGALNVPRALARRAASRATAADDFDMSSAAASLEALLPHLEAMASPRVDGGGLKLAAQRALFRILRPYWFQQRQLHTALIDALRRTSAAIRQEEHRREALDDRVRELTEELIALKRDR